MEGFLPNEVLYRKKSPYPKTHNPVYEKLVKEMLTEVLDNEKSPIHQYIDADEVRIMMKEPSDYGKPWFGQLMARPQLFAWIIQADEWFSKILR